METVEGFQAKLIKNIFRAIITFKILNIYYVSRKISMKDAYWLWSWRVILKRSKYKCEIVSNQKNRAAPVNEHFLKIFYLNNGWTAHES